MLVLCVDLLNVDKLGGLMRNTYLTKALRNSNMIISLKGFNTCSLIKGYGQNARRYGRGRMCYGRAFYSRQFEVAD